jgi:hypothetical protein
MKTRICGIDPAALERLPEKTGDKSGIGVHYVDAYVKPMNVTLPDGVAVKVKRKGLKVTLTVGEKKGEALLRRIEHGGNPVAMLDAALAEAAQAAGLALTVEDGGIWSEL